MVKISTKEAPTIKLIKLMSNLIWIHISLNVDKRNYGKKLRWCSDNQTLKTNFSTTATFKKSKAHSDLETGYKNVFKDYWPSMWSCLFPPAFLFTTFVGYRGLLLSKYSQTQV